MKKVPVKLTNKRASTFMLVDDEDYDWAMSYKWHVSSQYATTGGGVRSKYRIRAHQHLCPTTDGFEVDHINRDKLDNRRSNLRAVTRQTNMNNVGKRASNRSGYVGVNWARTNKKWRAEIRIDGKGHTLGHSDSIINAVLAYRLFNKIKQSVIK